MTGLVIAPLAATAVALVGLGAEHRLLPVRGRHTGARPGRSHARRAATTNGPATSRAAGPVTGLVTGSVDGSATGLVAGLGTAPIAGPAAGRLVRRPATPTDADVAIWCDRMARRVRTGDTLGAAIRATEPPPSTRAAVTPIVLALDRGADVTTAVRAVPIRSAGLDTALSVIGACARLGGPAAEPLDRVASTLRRRVAEAADRRTQSAQARASALTLTVLPVAFVLVLTASSASVRAGVASTPGAIAVATGLALNLAGWCWMRRIIRGAS